MEEKEREFLIVWRLPEWDGVTFGNSYFKSKSKLNCKLIQKIQKQIRNYYKLSDFPTILNIIELEA